jgi:hypothetical protein
MLIPKYFKPGPDEFIESLNLAAAVLIYKGPKRKEGKIGDKDND